MAAAAGSFDLSRLPCISCLLATLRCLTQFLLSLGLSLCCLFTSSRWPIVTSIQIASVQAGRGRGRRCMQAALPHSAASERSHCSAAVHGRLFCIPCTTSLSLFHGNPQSRYSYSKGQRAPPSAMEEQRGQEPTATPWPYAATSAELTKRVGTPISQPEVIVACCVPGKCA